MNPLVSLITKAGVLVVAAAAILGFDVADAVKMVTEYGDRLWPVLTGVVVFVKGLPADIQAVKDGLSQSGE